MKQAQIDWVIAITKQIANMEVEQVVRDEDNTEDIAEAYIALQKYLENK